MSGWLLLWYCLLLEVVLWFVLFFEFVGIICNVVMLCDVLYGYLCYCELIGNVDWVFVYENGDVIVIDYVNEGDGWYVGSVFVNFVIFVVFVCLYDL